MTARTTMCEYVFMDVQNGASALLMASEQGHLNIVKILLQHHARVDVFDEVTTSLRSVATYCYCYGLWSCEGNNKVITNDYRIFMSMYIYRVGQKNRTIFESM